MFFGFGYQRSAFRYEVLGYEVWAVSAKARRWDSVGGGVRRLTTMRQRREAMRAGKMASRSARLAGRWVWMKALSQKTVTKVPVKMLATAAEAVARRQ